MAAPRSDCGRSPSLARPGGGRLVSARTPVAEGRLGPIEPVTTFQSANKFSETDHRRLRVSSHEIRISLRENAPCAPGSSPGRGESSAVRGGWAGRASGTRPRHPRTAIRTRPPVTDRPASSCRDDPSRRAGGPTAPVRSSRTGCSARPIATAPRPANPEPGAWAHTTPTCAPSWDDLEWWGASAPPAGTRSHPVPLVSDHSMGDVRGKPGNHRGDPGPLRFDPTPRQTPFIRHRAALDRACPRCGTTRAIHRPDHRCNR